MQKKNIKNKIYLKQLNNEHQIIKNHTMYFYLGFKGYLCNFFC